MVEGGREGEREIAHTEAHKLYNVEHYSVQPAQRGINTWLSQVLTHG